MTIITSKSNNLIKKVKKLKQKKYRKTSYLIEGWHLYEEALKAKVDILNIFVLEELKERLDQSLPITCVSEDILRELCDSPNPQGIIAEVAYENREFSVKANGKYLLLEDVQDPGNVGTIIRTADAAGYDAVFISDKSADIYNQKTLRSMQGSHFHIPVYRQSVLEVLELMTSLEIPVLASTLSSQSKDYKSIVKPDSFLLVLGNEGQGISPMLAKRANQLVHITMPGQAESLNVAVAAGILIFSFI